MPNATAGGKGEKTKQKYVDMYFLFFLFNRFGALARASSCNAVPLFFLILEKKNIVEQNFASYVNKHARKKQKTKMYMLVKDPKNLQLVLEMIVQHNHVHVHNVLTMSSLSKETSEFIYEDMRDSSFYKDAVDSLVNQNVVFVLFCGQTGFDIQAFKKQVQGVYGTNDPSTIRGILSQNGRVKSSFVHVPDTHEKSARDIARVLEELATY
jgi:nucleoside diphosphate kinase